jgi:ubiquinone/menaquinone biosynthesis C-methylase UbiE
MLEKGRITMDVPILKHWFSSPNVVRDWFEWYKQDEPVSLTIQNVLSRKRFALSLLEEAVAPGSRVLDAGCGAGAFAKELARRGYDVEGIDLSEAMVEAARKNVPSVRFHVGSVERLPFSENTFDAVTCLGVLEYLDGDEAALREIRRVLKPGGHAILGVPSTSPIYYLDCMLQRLMRARAPLYRALKHRTVRLTRSRQWSCPLRNRRYSRLRWRRMLLTMHLNPEGWISHTLGFYALERFLNVAGLSRAMDSFAGKPALNWFGCTHIVRVRAIKWDAWKDPRHERSGDQEERRGSTGNS